MAKVMRPDLIDGPMRPIEAILNYGSKQSTYKFALIRAINDWVIEHATEDGRDHEVSVAWIAIKFLEYYWPLVASDRVLQMPQKRGRDLHLAGLVRQYLDRDLQGKGW